MIDVGPLILLQGNFPYVQLLFQVINQILYFSCFAVLFPSVLKSKPPAIKNANEVKKKGKLSIAELSLAVS